jgi:hypothetical protein
MMAGTSMVRTMSESSAMAVAMPRPIILMLLSVVLMKAAKTTIWMQAAEVMVLPVMARQ